MPADAHDPTLTDAARVLATYLFQSGDPCFLATIDVLNAGTSVNGPVTVFAVRGERARDALRVFAERIGGKPSRTYADAVPGHPSPPASPPTPKE